LNSIADEIHAEPEWSGILLDKPQVLGVDKLGESGVVIKVIAQTRPSKQWAVMRELNKRIKNRFDLEGIEIPNPHVKVILNQEQNREKA
jgi:small conductance mechanosensitive channel